MNRTTVIQYIKVAAIFVALLVSHLFFNSWGLVAAFCVLGIAIALWGSRGLLLTVALAELAIGIGFWLFDWNGVQLQALADNAGISPVKITGIAIAVNLLTALLVTAASFSLATLIRFRVESKP